MIAYINSRIVFICLFFLFPLFYAMRALPAAGPTPVPAIAETTTWPFYNNTLDGLRFSTLDQITPANISELRETCRIKVADGGAFESGLLMVEDTLFVTAHDETMAISPIDCSLRWKSSYKSEQPEVWPINRGVAYANGRVFRGTGDGELIALDSKTGAVVWEEAAADPLQGEFFSAAPIVWEGELIIGTAGSDWGARGRIMAFDASTGRELWRFYTIPTGREIGSETWKDKLAALTGGGGTWTTYTLDLSNGELFVPVGNPAPDFLPGYRPGDNLFTDSVVVLDARTGGLKWWYQLSPHDGRDLDLGAAPVLFRNRKGHRFVGFAGKDGYAQAVDRETHKLVFRTAITTLENESKTPTTKPMRFCPGALGGTEWNGPAFDRNNDNLIVPAVDWCSILTSGPENLEPGKPFQGGTYSPEGQNAAGWLTAVDAFSGRIRWRYHSDSPMVAGVTPTAGGVTFTGDMAGNFLAFESATGKLLRKEQTGGAIAGGVITYSYKKKQYVALTSGNVSRASFGVLGHPTIIIMGLDPAGDQGRSDEPTRSAESSESKEAGAETYDPNRGATLYAANCGVCHGGGGEGGGGGPSLRKIETRKTFAEIIEQIQNPKPPMPKLYPSILSKADVNDLTAYLEKSFRTD
jgi:alcohol dehydrogenase (cytochrome c)